MQTDIAAHSVQPAYMAGALEITSQLKALREEAGLSVRAMADAAEMSSSSYVHYESPSRFKASYLPLDKAKTFANVLVRHGVAKQRVLQLAGMDAAGEAPSTADDEMIPVYDVQASAGFGSLVDYEEQTHSLAFPPDYLRKLTNASPLDLVIISTKGDSMEPTLLDDDIVLVDTSKRHMGYEGMFVIRHNDTLLVKRAGMAAKNGFVTLISDNKAYPPLEAALTDLHVVGKVLWYGRKV